MSTFVVYKRKLSTKQSNNAGIPMKKQIKNGITFAKVALRHWSRANQSIHHQMFWDALNGHDRHECEDHTQAIAAREYFESDEYANIKRSTEMNDFSDEAITKVAMSCDDLILEAAACITRKENLTLVLSSAGAPPTFPQPINLLELASGIMCGSYDPIEVLIWCRENNDAAA